MTAVGTVADINDHSQLLKSVLCDDIVFTLHSFYLRQDFCMFPAFI